MSTRSIKSYCQTAGSAWKRVRARTIQVECIGSTHHNLLSEPWYESDDRMTRQVASNSWTRVRWLQVCWLQVRTWHDCSYIAWIPLLAHGLTVKLSPCPLAIVVWLDEWLYMCGHSKCNLVLAQARPRMIQHPSSIQDSASYALFCVSVQQCMHQNFLPFWTR